MTEACFALQSIFDTIRANPLAVRDEDKYTTYKNYEFGVERVLHGTLFSHPLLL